ncbi:hypothetical protein MNB_SV-15-731 [hydrothermal vent metagenome]|uniref:Hemerythrin-like domain-containing protein n=1 Tax=hydrothermal vent metagenome TaxID=652676 RepID=A0A1W1EKM5_9ZZZZ
MFDFLFPSKNKQLVKKWIKEHRKIVSLANAIIEAYKKGDLKKAKKRLNQLNNLTIEHLMQEDLSFYKLKKNSNKLEVETIEKITEFTDTFGGTKVTLMNFISKYAKPNVELDKEFINTFKILAGILVERIQFEESNLYQALIKE